MRSVYKSTPTPPLRAGLTKWGEINMEERKGREGAFLFGGHRVPLLIDNGGGSQVFRVYYLHPLTCGKHQRVSGWCRLFLKVCKYMILRTVN